MVCENNQGADLEQFLNEIHNGTVMTLKFMGVASTALVLSAHTEPDPIMTPLLDVISATGGLISTTGLYLMDEITTDDLNFQNCVKIITTSSFKNPIIEEIVNSSINKAYDEQK